MEAVATNTVKSKKRRYGACFLGGKIKVRMHVVAQKTTTSFDNSIKELSSSRDNYKIIHSKRLNVFKICFSIQFVLNFVLKQVCHENFDLHLLS